jgi:cell division protein ZapA
LDERDRDGAMTEALQEPATKTASGSVSVDIYDQVYNLRGPDGKYIEQLAELVDAKMRAVAAHGATVDSLRVAVLAALNIADELMELRMQYDRLASSRDRSQHAMRSRAGTLAGMLDEVLDERKAG